MNVFTAGGFPTQHPLFATKGVQFTPHIAAISEEADYDVRRRGCQAVVDVLSGRWSEHPVDPTVQPRFGSLAAH
jgi:phosphoglycerate dehydrogenase-like enzyme